MKKLTSMICAASIFLPMALAQPALSAPLNIPAPVLGHSSGSVVDVQYRHRRGHYNSSRYHYRKHRYDRRYDRRHYHRRSNGNAAAAIIGGLAAGAIISGMANQSSAGSRTNSHVNWCMNKYRSYDPRSDTFQPYNGGRKYCNSPYR